MKTFQFVKIDKKGLTIQNCKILLVENIDVWTDKVAWAGSLKKILDLFIYDSANIVAGGSKI